MNKSCLFVGMFLVLIAAPSGAALPPPNVVTPKTEVFLGEDGQLLMALVQGDKLRALYGGPIAVNKNDIGTAQWVKDWLFDPIDGHKDVLGVPNVDLVLRRSITIRNGKSTIFTYTQQIGPDNLPANGSEVKVLVRHMDPAVQLRHDTIAYINISLLDPPATPLPSAGEITYDLAKTAVLNAPQYADCAFVDESKAAKVVFKAIGGALHRAWRFAGSCGTEDLQFFVNTTTSVVVGTANLSAHATVQGTVKGMATQGELATGAVVLEPLSGVDVSFLEGSVPACPSDGGTPAAPSESTVGSGVFGPTEVGALPVRVTARLSSNEFVVYDCSVDGCVVGGIYSAFDPTNAVQNITCSLVDTGSGDPSLVFDATCESSALWCEDNGDCPVGEDCTGQEFGTAMVNAYEVARKTREWIVALQTSVHGLLEPLDIYVNSINFPCNGNYSASRIVLNRSSDRCNNTAFSTFASHEYGHYLHNELAGGILGSSHSEAVADIIPSLIWNTPCIFRGAYFSEAIDGSWEPDDDQACVRNLDRTCPGTCATDSSRACNYHYECNLLQAGYVGPCIYGEQCDNVRTNNQLSMAGGFWDLQKTLRCCSSGDPDSPDAECDGAATCDAGCLAGESCIDRPTEELFTDYLMLSTPVQTGALLNGPMLLEVLVADDDNADLTDGTPHCKEILCAFVGRNSCDVPPQCQFTDPECPNEPGDIEPGHGFACPDFPVNDFPRNRYIRFDPSGFGAPVKFRVTLDSSLNHPDALGQTMWIGNPDGDSISLAEVGEPLLRNWVESEVFVTGCFISPVATYEISSTTDGIEFEPLVEVSTIEQPGSAKFWGDVVGSFNGVFWSEPQGTTNIDDAVSAIRTWQVAPGAPHKSVTDVEPQFINKVVNFNDVLMLVMAFKGDPYPFGCPEDPCQNNIVNPCPGEPTGGGEQGVSTLSLSPSADLILQGELFNVDVFLDPAEDPAYLGGLQLGLEVTGGDAGSLDLEDLSIDNTRSDYVFLNGNSVESISAPRGQLGAAMLDGTGIPVTELSYLGTFQFRASSDAVGVFNIRFRDIEENFLMNGDAQVLTGTITGAGIYIGVEVGCATDADCDDSNPCTDDTCNNGTCVYTSDDSNSCTDGNECTDDACVSGTCVSTNDDTNTCTDGNDCTADSCLSGACTSTNEPASTPCDDGLFCTKFDLCDGAGTCVGSGSPCKPTKPYCCEYLSICAVMPCH